MRRRPAIDLSAWPSLTLEGNLIAPAMLARVAATDAETQDAADYGVRKGLTLREEVSLAFRVGQAHWDAFAKLEATSQQAAIRFARDFLTETFGFDDLAPGPAPVALAAGDGRVPVVVVPPSDDLDRRSPTLSTERSRSAAFALQDHLNAQDDALWGLALNGPRLRLMRDNASLTRPAYIEADLAQIFATEDLASFAALWLLIHRSRFGNAGDPAADCALERWREAGAREGEAARDRLAVQVKDALAVLGSGFLAANPELRERLGSGEIGLTPWFNELLRLVYRLIFLMVAEDRDLLHPPDADPDARRLYAEGYSLAVLRRQSIRRTTWDRHHDRYEGLRIVFRALFHGEPRLALPALGGLFDRSRIPDLEDARLPNRALMEAVFRLAWLRDGGGIVPVNWRAMETEELGSVYESLLELQPQLTPDGRSLIFAEDAAETKGNQRKTTGSYYTPDSLVQALLDTALDPVLDRAEGEADDPAEALLNLKVIDPACGSGHFLLAAARRIATRLARRRAEGTPSAADFRHALRDVARRCLHGVDRNPMAVELAKVALWIETVDPGRPLGFFDAQIRCGDALLGVFDLSVLAEGIPDAAYKPLAGDAKETAKHFLRRNRDEREGQGRLDFEAGGGRLPDGRALGARLDAVRDMPEDSVAAIEAKAAAWEALRRSTAFYDLEAACNLHVAAFLLPKIGEPPASPGAAMIPTTAVVRAAARGGTPYGPLLGAATEAAEEARAFHWPLEFPDVMSRGGFDAVVGNPPWERIKLQEKEFFAARDPEIAGAPNAAARGRLIERLREAEPGSPRRALWEAFETEKRISEATSAFVRVPSEEGGRFPLTGRGDVNTYALFAELFARLVDGNGHAGIIVPTGVSTDSTTAPFFAWLIEQKRITSLIDFENSSPIFPNVHRSFKFCLLTMGRGEDEARFAFFLNDLKQLTDHERNFNLSPEQIGMINPNTKTAPVFRSRLDAELTVKFYQNAPVFILEGDKAKGNLWNASFYTRIWHMAEDSDWFRTGSELAAAGYVRDGSDWIAEDIQSRQTVVEVKNSGARSLSLDGGRLRAPRRFVPLYEAKMIHVFDHRWAGYNEAGTESSYATVEEKQDPIWEPQPRYWVPADEVAARLGTKGWHHGWLVGWRKITNTTNERTLICTVFPRSAAGDSLPLALPDTEPALICGLIANLSCLSLDFVERRKLGGTNLTFQYLFQLPILPPAFYNSDRLAFVVPRVLELTYTSHSLAPFARDLGHDGPPFAWDEDRRAHLRAELDAFYARAYGLTRDELRYILDPADVKGPDYPSETFRVLKTNEIRRFGEYRTARLVLAAWDRMEADGSFAAMQL